MLYRPLGHLLLLLGLCVGFYTPSQAESLIRPLHQHWKFRQYGTQKWHPAQVPGTVHTDLYAQGLIPHPYNRQNATQLTWIEEKDWEYEIDLTLSPEELAANNKNLRFHGLDTYTDIYLNDSLLLQTNNMFRTWELDITHLLKPKKNKLRIRFKAPVNQVVLLPQSKYRLPADNDISNPPQSMYTRKAAYQFGWDWAPRLPSMGIWKDIELLTWSDGMIQDFSVSMGMGGDGMTWYPIHKGAIEGEAALDASIHFKADHGAEYHIQVLVEGKIMGEGSMWYEQGDHYQGVDFRISDPKLWWPAGYGAQHLYSATAVLRRQETVIDTKTCKFGIRTIELIQEPDAIGTSFYFRVNGRPIYIKGTNYIPTDLFLPQGRAKKTQLFEAMQATHMNMVRIWGGGAYEDDTFYNTCDSLGILVWQDLMFAGGMYPTDPDFRENVLQEVREQAIRLSRHPSLALWCGNNEIEVAWFNWGWQKKYGISPTDSTKAWEAYQYLFAQEIPEALRFLPPGISFISSSPISNWGKPEYYNSGNLHDWEVWHGDAPFEVYKQRVPRFAAEYGFQSYPALATLKPYTAEEDLRMDSEWMQFRQKSYKGNTPILEAIRRYYGKPKDFSSFLILSQLAQTMAMKIAIEAHRTHQPHCMGTLYWQLNDCWPGPSWSTIDYHGRWKAAHYALKRLYAPILVTTELQDQNWVVHVVSDLLEAKTGNLSLKLLSFNGDSIKTFTKQIPIPPQSSTVALRLSNLAWTGLDPSTTFLETCLEVEGKVVSTDINYFEPPSYQKLATPQIDYTIHKEAGRCWVTLKSNTLVRNLEIKGGKDEALRFSDNYLDLLPGHEYTIEIHLLDNAPFLETLAFQSLIDWLKPTP